MKTLIFESLESLGILLSMFIMNGLFIVHWSDPTTKTLITKKILSLSPFASHSVFLDVEPWERLLTTFSHLWSFSYMASMLCSRETSESPALEMNGCFAIWSFSKRYKKLGFLITYYYVNCKWF